MMHLFLYIFCIIQCCVDGQTLGNSPIIINQVSACTDDHRDVGQFYVELNIFESHIGRVYVGENASDLTDVYTFNENYIHNLSVPVYVTVEDDFGTEKDPAQPLPVTVECELKTAGLNGYSSATFSTVPVILTTGTAVLVPFNTMVPGRATDIQCWGVSSDTTIPHFTKGNSIANTKLFEVRPAGTVSTCLAVIKVPQSNAAIDSTLDVELSEDIEIGNVTINCASDTTGITDPISVIFEAVTIGVGQRAEVPYQVAPGGINPVPVTCTANTIIASGNRQFYTANSTGDGSTFTIEMGTAQLVPLLTQLRATQLTAYLVLDAPVITEVNFACRVEVTNDTASAVIIAQNTECLPLDTTPPGVGTTEISFTTEVTTDTSVNTTGVTMTTEEAPTLNISDGWNLRNPSVVFSQNSYYQTVEIFRQGQDVYNQAIRPEVVVVHCCAPESVNINTDGKYVNKSAAFAAVVYLSPNVTTSWDKATDPANALVETSIINPAYVELSPCPCDLTNKSCDVNCCCDTFCTEDDLKTFECIPGIKGGTAPVANAKYMCSSEDYFGKADWFPFMCIQFENSAFLGFFRQPINATRTQTDFNDRLQNYDPKYSYEQKVVPSPLEIGGNDAGYKEGLAVKTGLPVQGITEDLFIGPNYRLVLPGRSLSGQCVFSNPVGFGKESSETCVWSMRESLCSTASPLNALNYALPVSGSTPNCRKGLLALQDQGVKEVAQTNVDYHCAGSDPQYLTPYLRSTDTVKQRIPDDEVKLFDDELPNGGDDCYFDTNTGAYICSEITPSTPSTPFPPRCSWDNGYTKAPTPQLDETPDIPVCRDAVVEVRYNFTWKGPQVVLLNATVVLGDIPMLQEVVDNIMVTYQQGNDIIEQMETVTTNYTTDFTQILNVEWHHQINESVNTSAARTSDVYKRSGIQGYEIDLPVYSGVSIYNASEFLYIDQNTSSILGLWKAGPDSLCDSSTKEPISFRQSGMGSCLLRLGLEQLKNCTYLRKLVLNQQDELMNTNYISQSGDPDPALLEDWLRIYRQDMTSIIGNDSLDMTTLQPMTTETVADPNATYDYRSNVIGICPNIPSHINVDIMYGEVGKVTGNRTYEIIGAKISYTLTSWSLYCTAADGASCYGDTTWLETVAKNKSYVQSFVVSSSVNFIQAPANTPVPQSKRAVSMSNNHFVCRYDACTAEAFYPFREGFIGDSFQYVLSFSLISVLFLIGIFMISRPWW